MSFDRWGRPVVRGYGMQRKIAEDVYKQWEAKQREEEESTGWNTRSVGNGSCITRVTNNGSSITVITNNGCFDEEGFEKRFKEFERRFEELRRSFERDFWRGW